MISPIALAGDREQLSRKLKLMQSLPELLLTTTNGGTIHKYELTGGKTAFTKYLGCHKGNCKFYNDFEEASSDINRNI